VAKADDLVVAAHRPARRDGAHASLCPGGIPRSSPRRRRASAAAPRSPLRARARAVWASDINAAALAELEGREGIHTRARRHRRRGDRKVAAEVGDIDVLFNCAGIVQHGTILDARRRTGIFSFNLNVKSMYLVARAFLPGMLKKGKGSIINMASIASSVWGLPNRFVYGATKAAVMGLTKSIAADYVKPGIRCNASARARWTRPRCSKRINAQADPAQARKDFIARQPMGRLGTVDDITGILVFLASDESLFATGQPVLDRRGNDDMKLCRYGKAGSRNLA
jgi:2-keto-3-deoxy-L-fuconate dehydrogenase